MLAKRSRTAAIINHIYGCSNPLSKLNILLIIMKAFDSDSARKNIQQKVVNKKVRQIDIIFAILECFFESLYVRVIHTL